MGKTASAPLGIAIVLNRFYPEIGGAEINLFFQASELALAHQVEVFTPRRLAEAPKRETVAGFRVFRLCDWRNIRRRFPNLGRDTFMPGIFFRILFGNHDVIQAFPSLHLNTLLAFLAAKIRRKPFILCSFDLLDYAEIEKRTGVIDPDILASYTPRKWKQLILRHCDHIFAISEREIDFFRRYNDHVSFSPVPVKPEEYEIALPDVRREYGIAGDAMLFLVLGRVSRIKGQDIAAQAFIKAAAAMPGSRLVFVGRNDYEPEFVDAIRRAIAGHQLQDRVLFTGMIAREKVTAFLTQSDIHVVPVRFMNAGAVVVESWAAGTPVIQSDAVDPNLVEPGRNGYLFPSQDVDALACTMIRAFGERDKLPEFGRCGREKVLRDFTYRRLVEIYDAEYRRLCPGRR